MDDLYQQQILDHFKDPQNFGKINRDCKCSEENNPMCGDQIEMSVCIADGQVKDIKFDGQGCAVSMASTSMLTEKVKGMKLEEVKKIGYADIEKMLGIPLSSSRKKCAYLGLQVLVKIIN